jgi:uncharacterized membrane protein YfcA
VSTFNVPEYREEGGCVPVFAIQPDYPGGLCLVGFLTGVMVGLTSMGGAALMTPFLILIVGVRPVMAVGTDLLFGTLTKLAGAWMHWRQGTVDLVLVRRLASGSLPGAVAGAFVITYMRTRGVPVDQYVRIAIGVVLVCVSLLILGRSLLPSLAAALPLGALQSKAGPITRSWGALAGIAVGLTSVGSGSLITPFLMIMLPGKLTRVVGTDIFHGAILVTTASCFYVASGQVEWRLIPLLLMGSLPGVLLGSRLANLMPPHALRVVLGLILLVTGIKLF